MAKKISTAKVIGASGRQYPFDVYDWDTIFRVGLAGVYMIARRFKKPDGNFELEPIYVGEREDLSLIFGFHKNQACIQKYYPNCRCIYLVKDADTRKEIVEDLIEKLAPHCNET